MLHRRQTQGRLCQNSVAHNAVSSADINNTYYLVYISSIPCNPPPPLLLSLAPICAVLLLPHNYLESWVHTHYVSVQPSHPPTVHLKEWIQWMFWRLSPFLLIAKAERSRRKVSMR